MSTCLWYEQDEDGEVWSTGCGNLFGITSGTPSENSFKFCCYCGRPLVEERHESEGEDAEWEKKE